MNETLKAAIAEATRLTQAGRLSEATALMQRALTGCSLDLAAAQTSSVADDAQSVAGAAAGPQPGAGAGKTAVQPDAPSPDAVRRVDGARPMRGFTRGSYSNTAGSRDYRLFVPERRLDVKPPLLVMLHGCAQDPEDFAAVTRMNGLAEVEGLVVLYPAQSLGANVSGCWNWYSPEHQRRDAGEPGILAGMTRQVVASLDADHARVFVAGFSAGGAMAATLAAIYPDLFAAVGVHSGVRYAAAQDMVSAMSVMAQGPSGREQSPRAVRPVPVIVFQGDADMTVHPANAAPLVAQFLPDREGGAGPIRVEREALVSAGGSGCSRARYFDGAGVLRAELWTLNGLGHGWSGGDVTGRFSEPEGPDASQAMLRFFLSVP
ncbi:extracellular catalytic domain type 1 short-chain-length polyhydroxyalkanoate depolymerase [Thiocystis violacea]|uniref:extracellular catalytic domain type 1 short-chain-length polyhydroxyalkanoate depolymerase n=1 Tax=Thiocystis violacea TaxID=13725 RepID=UPI001904D536